MGIVLRALSRCGMITSHCCVKKQQSVEPVHLQAFLKSLYVQSRVHYELLVQCIYIVTAVLMTFYLIHRC